MTAGESRTDGVGCRTIVSVLLAFAAFAVVAVAVGLALVLRGTCGTACQAVGFTLYAAGAPVSGLFAALAGELPLAWMTDLGLWIVVSAGTARLVERRGLRPWQAVAPVIGVALAYGAVVAAFLERI